MDKEFTMEELKSMISETVKEGIGPELEAIKTDLAGVKASNTSVSVLERAEKSAEFLKELRDFAVTGVGKKTITTDNASFGYTVPTELAQAVYEKKDKISKIRKNAFVFQMSGKFQLPFEGTAVTAYWITTEANADITESNPTTTKKDLDDYYLVARVRVPYKLLDTSAINVEQYITNLASRALVNTEETAFVAGSGSDQPTGIRTASITQGGAQAGANLTYNDLVNTYLAVPEQYRANGSWLVSTAALKLIMKLTDLYGMPLFSLTNPNIFGKPVLEVTDIPANLGTSINETEIYFGDLKEYWIKDGQTMRAEVEKVPGRLQMDVYLYQAVDGVLVNVDAFAKLTGVK